MKRMMHCYGCGKLLAIIDVNAISGITWHENGMYIYWNHLYDEYGEIESYRAGVIICEWTKVEMLEDSTISYLKRHNTPVIFKDDTIYPPSSALHDDYITIEPKEAIGIYRK